MAGKGKGARGKGSGKPPSTTRETRKRKELATEHVEGQAPGETQKQKEGMTTPHQEPGPSQEGKRKKKETVTVQDTQPESLEDESESDSEWQGTVKWQHHVPQSIETPDFVILSVPPSFKKLMWGVRLCGPGGLPAKHCE